MQLVVDTNILISALVARAITFDTILLGNLELSTPEHTLEEIERNREDLQKRMKISQSEFSVVLNILLSHVTVIPREQYIHTEEKAKTISPHYKDFPFFALALAKGLPIWSNELRLKNQEIVKVYNIKEVLDFV
ncbi:MAG: PIN domain-containing protein [Candidatus Micrarchaeota archaeon]|nr:PIN domain-containing protein [Candidatus Micrarchaeota archaeon]